MCQGCVDAGYLSQQVYDKLEAFKLRFPRAAYGPAHIVLDDANVLDHNLEFCLNLIRASLSGKADQLPAEIVKIMDGHGWYHDYDREELAETTSFLEELLLIPEDER